MSTPKKVSCLCLSIFGIMIVPYIGAYIYADGKFEKDYFDFPPLKPEEVFNNFSWPVFWAVAVIFAITMLLYFFPTLFGWKKGDSPIRVHTSPAVAFPIWFWAGLVVWAGSLIFLMQHLSGPTWFLNWAYVPLYWGFTFMLDGIVYKRTRGKSIFNNDPQELLGIGVASVSGWLIFEYLNFFVLEYWYYPKGGLVIDDEFCTYAVFASSALLPLCFEWYSLFNTFPRFVNKYKYGPKISFSKSFQVILIVLAYIALFLMSFYPTYLCPVIWLSPLIIITVTLDLLDIWTPFAPIKKGKWTPVLFMALTYLLEGFLLEGQNYLSAGHANGLDTNYPGYWMYNVPFVNRFHVFEMPVVGFYGYLPFGIYCLVWWISFAFLLKIPTDFAKYEDPVY
jgi:hypothetical protein